MFSSADKIVKSTPAVQQKTAENTFFKKAGEDSFFGAKENQSFFGKPVQAKLTVSTPDDPQEKEADAVAGKVMRTPEPAAAAPLTVTAIEDDVQRKEEEEIRSKEQTSSAEIIPCKEDNEGRLHAKPDIVIRRSDEEHLDAKKETVAGAGNDQVMNSKNTSLYHSDIVQRSGRGPPAGTIPFEQKLASSKGGGSALPDNTRQFMENRFNADFGGVRIHTGSTAEHLSRSVNAQAFAHGNDVYFNKGKFSPHTAEGGTLLAHELTHTIQQGGVIHRQAQVSAAKPKEKSKSAGTANKQQSKQSLPKDNKAGNAQPNKKAPRTKNRDNLPNGPPRHKAAPTAPHSTANANSLKHAEQNKKQKIKKPSTSISAARSGHVKAPSASIKNKPLAPNLKIAPSDIRVNQGLTMPDTKSPGSKIVLEALKNKSDSSRQTFINNVAQQSTVIQSALETHQQKVTAAGINEETRLRELFSQTRANITSRVLNSKNQLSSHAASQKASLEGGHSSSLDNLNTVFTAGQGKVSTLSDTYADKSVEAANNAANQFQTTVQSKVTEAHEIGNQRANVTDEDTDVQDAKREAAQQVATDTSGKMTDGMGDAMDGLRSTGPDTANEFRNQGAQAAGQLMSGKSQADAQVSQVFTNAGEGIGLMTDTANKSLDDNHGKLTDQLLSQENKVLGQLAKAVEQKQADFDAAGQSIMTTLRQQAEQATAAGDNQLLAISRQVAAAPINEQQAPEALGLVSRTIDPAFNSLNVSLNNSAQTINEGIGQKAAEATTAMGSMSATISSGIGNFNARANSFLQQSQQHAATQLTQASTQAISGANSIIEQVSAGVGQQIQTIDQGYLQGLNDYSSALADNVNKGTQQGTEPVNTLPGRITEAQQRAAERAGRSWLSNQLHDAWDALSDPGFWAGLLVGILLVALVIALEIVTAGTATIVIIALAAAIGGISAGVGSIVGQAMNHSFTGGWDWGRVNWAQVGKAVLIGAVAGAVIAGIAVALGLSAAGLGIIALGSLSSAVVGIISNKINGDPWDKGLLFNLTLGGLLAWIGGKFAAPRGEVPNSGETPVVQNPPVKPTTPGTTPQPDQPAPPAPASPETVPPEAEQPGDPFYARSLGLRQPATEALETLENLKRDPVGTVNAEDNHNHYSAARREAAGEVVQFRADGRPYSHISDLQQGCDGLYNVRNALDLEVRNPPDTITARGIDVLTAKLSEVNSLINRLNGFLNEIGHGSWPPYHVWRPGPTPGSWIP